MNHVRLRFRFLAVAAVAALALAAPLAVEAHEHQDQADSPCGICKATATGVPALESRREFRFPRHESRPGAPVTRFAASEPGQTSAIPRAPPA